MPGNRRIMIINHRPPHGTLHAWESLELTLTAAAFEQDVSVVFMGHGVFQLITGQMTDRIDVRNFAPAFRTFGDYGIHDVYAEKEAISRFGLAPEDFLIDVNQVDTPTLRELMANQDIILHF